MNTFQKISAQLVAFVLAPLLAMAQPTVLPNRSPVPRANSQYELGPEQLSVSAGQDETVSSLTATNIVTVQGLANFFPYWSKLTGPGSLTFSNDRASSNTVTASVAGTYNIRVRVSVYPYFRDDFKVVTFGTTPPANTSPTISVVAAQSAAEDTPTGAIGFTVGDNETAVGSLTVSAVSSNPGVVASAGIVLGGSGANRTITLTPVSNASGQTTITLSASDGTATAQRTFVLTVSAVNDAPQVSSIGNQNTLEDVATPQIGFTVTDRETAASSLTVTGASGNPTVVPNGSIVFSGSGNSRSVQITPGLNQTGSALITVTVGDGTTTTQIAFTVNVGSVNDAPTISAISGSTISEDGNTGAKPFTVADAETAAASLTLSGHSSSPSLVADTAIVFGGSGANRTVTVTPLANANGTATITVSVSDGTASTSTTWLLTVNAANDAPTITAIPNQSIIGSSSIDVQFTIQDLDGDTLFLSGSSDNQAVVANGGITFIGTGNNRTARITPASNANASCNITILVSDAVASASRTFLVTVQQVNSTPTISAIADQSGSEDGPFSNISFTIGDAETPPASLVLTKTSSNPGLLPDSGIVFGGSGANRTVTLTPTPNANGTTTVTIRVTDASSQFRDEAFTATWSGVNDAPTSTQIANVTMAEDSSASRTVDIADAETSASGLTLTASTLNICLFPSLTPTGSGSTRTIPLIPSADQTGTATVTYIVSDGQLSTTKSFTVTVTAVNETPTISNIANSAGSVGQAVVINFTAADHENEDAADALIYSKTSSNTTVVPTANVVFGGLGINRTVTVTGAAAGTSTITIRATDSGGLFAEDPFDFAVSGPANTAPTITGIGNQTISQNGNTGALAFTVGDAQTAPSSLVVSAVSSNPTLAPVANIVFGGSGASRTVTVTPVQNQTGTATITVSVSDGNLSTSGAFTLTVSGVNQVPVVAEIPDKTINQGGTIEFPVSATDGDSATVTWSAISSNPTLIPNASITFLDGTAKANRIRLVPASGASGFANISVIANDGIATLTSNVKIWDSAPHNAFTGLEFYNGAWFCVFREATSHLSSDGNIRVIRSIDGITWNSVALLTPGVGGSDLRDPHLSIARTSGSLRINADERIASPSSLKSVAYFSADGITWSGQSVIGSPNDWLWSINNGPDADYSISYSVANQPRLNLYRSTDGATFSKVTAAAGLGLTSQYTSEADIVFRSDGSAAAILRGDDDARGGTSPAPYTTWTWKTIGQSLGGQRLLLLSDGRIIGCTRRGGFGVTSTVSMARIIPERGVAADYQTLATSPDSAYADMVLRDGVIWVSYYSSHEGKASIYLAKLRPNVPAAFRFTVNAVNSTPTISGISDKTTTQGVASGPHSFTVGDAETPAANLTVSGSSSNPSLLPNSGITFGGSGASRTVTVAPASGQSGQATITLTVSDGSATAVTSFVLTVTASGGLVYHVKTSGTSGGSGTDASPWSLIRSFSRSGGKPEVGATVYIHADGRYDLGTTGASISANGVTWRGFADEWPNIGSDNLGSDRTTLHPSADDITLYQLAINNLGRVHPAEGIYTSGDARRLKIIHCIVFNLPQCIAFQDNRADGGGLEVYGTTLMFGGWNNSATDAGGHNIYFQHANMSDSLQFENNVSAYSFSKLLNCGGSAAAFNRNCLFFQNILLMDGAASQASSDLQRPTEYIALVGNTPIEAFIYKDNFHYGGQLLFGYPEPQNIDLTVTGNYEFHQGYANGTFSGMRFEKFNSLVITNNIVDASYEPTMHIDNSGAVTRTINRNSYHGTLNFNPGGSFAGWQGNGYDAQGSATTTHRDTLYIRYYLNTRYGHRHKSNLGIHNPQSASTINIDGAQAGLVNGDQFVILNALHPDLSLPHAYRVAGSGTYLGGSIAVSLSGLTIAQPAGVSYTVPNCYPRAGALIVKKLN